MKELQKELSEGRFHRIYLFCGEETYLKREYKHRLKEACIKDGDTINFNQYEGKGVDVGEIIGLSQTLPFFADYRLILLENTGFFKKSQDQLAEYAGQIPDTSILLFVEDEVDKRTRTFKAVKKFGRVVEFPRQTEKVLEKWVLGRLKKDGVTITRNALSLFFEKTGDDMENIASELEKLVCYCGENGSVTEESVEAICTRQLGNRIFEMIRCIGEKNRKRALDLYYDLLALKEPPLRILALLSRQFRLTYEVKELSRLRRSKEEIARTTGLNGYVVGQYVNQAQGFSDQELLDLMRQCVEVEEDVKKGRLSDKLGVELLIAAATSPA